MSDAAIRLEHVGKKYKVFLSRRAALWDAIGVPERRPRYREFWALRGIDLTLGKSQRLGVIGRNGAGKSTLLKLITQNIAPTEGRVEVSGQVQALLEVGGGLHPEFTGSENIHASLALLGLGDYEIKVAEAEIAAFTELGQFLDQPFKTYSLGMQGRLAFAIATTIEPEILIVDEVLGAGDAYFFARSTARMRKLIESGASVLLVSHSLDQVVRFCDETIWLDRGRIVMRGPSREVVKAYEKFVREIEQRRLEAKNRKLSIGSMDSFERENYADFLSVNLRSRGAAEIRGVRLLRNNSVEDEIFVGSPQDSDETQSVHITGAAWGPPAETPEGFYRSIEPEARAGDESVGVLFKLWFFYPDAEYSLTIEYRSEAELEISAAHGAGEAISRQLQETTDWATVTVPLTRRGETATAISRWPGSQALRIEAVRLLGDDDRETVVFAPGSRLRISVSVESRATGTYTLIPAALIFRSDGIVATRHIGEEVHLEIEEGDRFDAELDYGPLLLGDGTYELSVGLYRQLDAYASGPSEYYDYLDRSFEFRVDGSPPLHNEFVRHPGAWTVVRRASEIVGSAEVGRE